MNLDYTIIYSKRKRITITVERDRSVVVRAPEGTDENKVRGVVESRKAWLYEKLRHPQKYNSIANKKEFVSGESILYLGRNYRLEVIKDGEESIRFMSKFVVTGARSNRAGKLFKDWYVIKAKDKIIPRVKRHAQNMGVVVNKVMVSDLKYRWGSCTPNDNLNINWKLIKAPMFVIDYVIVHELAHLMESNHTKRFWNIVRTQAPMAEKAKSWLKENGEVLEQDL
jgi:predicted metal-dependent hydrolase